MAACFCTNRTDIRCDDTHCDIAGPGSPNNGNECRVCWNRLGLNPALHGRVVEQPPALTSSLRRYPLTFRKQHPCIHLGDFTGETRDCIFCGGAKNIPLRACALYGECTTEKRLAHWGDDGSYTMVELCLSCVAYQPET